jgi:hypothetical protein
MGNGQRWLIHKEETQMVDRFMQISLVFKQMQVEIQYYIYQINKV